MKKGDLYLNVFRVSVSAGVQVLDCLDAMGKTTTLALTNHNLILKFTENLFLFSNPVCLLISFNHRKVYVRFTKMKTFEHEKYEHLLQRTDIRIHIVGVGPKRAKVTFHSSLTQKVKRMFTLLHSRKFVCNPCKWYRLRLQGYEKISQFHGITQLFLLLLL